MEISVIVAVSKNYVIGVGNQLPWHLPADLKYFKSLTLNHPIVMGRKTFESIGRPLPKRENIVITRDTSFHHEGIVIRHSIDDAIQYCTDKNYNELFIIGGDTIYQQTLFKATRLYITQVDTEIENGTAFFPVIDLNEWKIVAAESHAKDEANQYDYTFEVYEKIR